MTRIGLFASLGIVVLATFVICWAYVPNNWDTCSYRISRAFFYLGKGNLLHAGNNRDPRLSFYPLNGTLSYIFLAIYQFGARSFNLVPAAAWIFAGLGSYSLARRLGASKSGGLVAAWVCMLAPAVLAEAPSGNDDVAAAGPILIGLVFALAGRSTGQNRFLLLAGLGFGLGAGAKLHWVFYSSFIALAVIWYLARIVRHPNFRSYWSSGRLYACAGSALLAAPLAASFLLCNYLSTRKLTATQFNNQVLNTPFRTSLALEKMVTSNSEMFLSPIPDLVPPVHPWEREPAYDAFNRFFMKCCFGGLKEVINRTPEGYIFKGPAAELAQTPAETRVWLGFMPHLLLLVCVVGFAKRELSLTALLCAVAFFFWHITYSLQTRYIGGAATYYGFPAVLAAGSLALAWDFARKSRTAAARIVLTGFILVFATHSLLAFNLLQFGELRSIQAIWQSHGRPSDMHAVDANIVGALRSASRVYIPGTHWEILYWNFMRFNPAAKYQTGPASTVAPPDTLTLLSVPSDISNGMFPVQVPADLPSPLVVLGRAADLPVFARGNQIEKKFPHRDRYAMLSVTWSNGAGSPPNAIECCLGLASNRLELRYDVRSKTTGLHQVSPWVSPGLLNWPPPGPPNERFATLTIDTRDPQHPDDLIRTSYSLDSEHYTLGHDESFRVTTQNEGLQLKMPDLVNEVSAYDGKRYSVNWLPRQLRFYVSNPAERVEAVIEMQLATLSKPRNAVLHGGGRDSFPPVAVTKIFWDHGAETVRYRVTLEPGENIFDLESMEAPESLSDGRQVCFLLIEGIKISLKQAK